MEGGGGGFKKHAKCALALHNVYSIYTTDTDHQADSEFLGVRICTQKILELGCKKLSCINVDMYALLLLLDYPPFKMKYGST